MKEIETHARAKKKGREKERNKKVKTREKKRKKEKRVPLIRANVGTKKHGSLLRRVEEKVGWIDR